MLITIKTKTKQSHKILNFESGSITGIVSNIHYILSHTIDHLVYLCKKTSVSLAESPISSTIFFVRSLNFNNVELFFIYLINLVM